MNYKLSIPTTGSSTAVIGTSHPKLGLGYHESAAAFVHDYPVGSFFTVDDFDAWIIAHGMATPPTNREKQSDGWLAFLQRRHQAKTNLNKAGAHQRMTDSGLTPFCIYQHGKGQFEVRKPFDAAISGKIGHQVNTLVKTKHTNLTRLLQSIDMQELPPMQQSMVCNLHNNLEDFKDRIEFEANRLNNKYEALRDDVRRLVMLGQIQTKNGGIKALTDDSDNDEEGA